MTSHYIPENLLDPRSRDIMPSLYNLVQCLPRIQSDDNQLTNNEWRNVDSIPLPNLITSASSDPVLLYNNLGNMTVKDEYLFKTLAAFSLNILVLPVAKTDAEKLF